jgi:uncharacterized membrane protein
MRLLERVRSSLFFVPMLFVVGAVLLGEASLAVDRAVSVDGTDLPWRLGSTVGAARAVLTTVAAATITFAGIAFSVALLIFQLASSQYSPRVIHGLFRDPFNKRVMGFVVGTFSYCLVVLRTVRSETEDGGEAVIPYLSVGLAVVLGISAVLAIIAFIDHAAHMMDVSEILQRVTDDTIEQAGGAAPVSDRPELEESTPSTPEHPGVVVRFDSNGWLQQVDHEALLGLVGDGGMVELHSAPGRYAIADTALCTIWRPVEDCGPDELAGRARAAVQLGATRTMQQDHSYGLRQIVDVAVRALSPGVNDPTTAQDAIFHAAAVLCVLVHQPTRAAISGAGSRWLLLPEVVRRDELVGLAFDEIRLSARNDPTVCIYLLEALRLVGDAVREHGLDEVVRHLERQAALVVEGVERAELPASDLARVRAAHATRFSAGPSN